jgi:hypothetical protein
MRGLLLLSIVGVALYALLLITDNALRESHTEQALVEAQPSHAVDRTLRAWGRNLPALVIQQPSEPPSQESGGDFGADGQLVASEKSTEAKLDYAAQEPVEWAEIVLAARAHSEASVSSPTIRFYTPGIELQIVRRQDGWVEVIDPATQERGWVFERYVLSVEGPNTQSAMDSGTEVKLSTPKSTSRALPSAKQRNRSANPVVQAAETFITKSEMRRARWAGRDDRRRRFGLFGRRFAPFGAAW